MNQPTLFPPTARLTFMQRAMALSDPQWQSIEPKRELVFPVGEPVGNDDRRWRFTPEDLAAVVADFGTRTELAPAYYCHGEDPSRGKMAAGWIDRVELADDGLYAFIRYTEKALTEIKDGAWGYRSPGFDAEQDAEGYWRPRRLSEVSLVNDPAIGGMPPIQAATQPAATTHGEQEEEPTMADLTSVTAAKKQSAAFDKPGLMALLRKEYGMPEAVSDEMLTKMLMEALAGAPEMPDEAEKEPDNPAAPPVEIPAAASVKPRIELVEDPKDTARIIASVQKAASLGTITPQTLEAAGKLAGADIEAFERIFCQPPAPAAGRLINASAKDRAMKAPTYADTVRAARNAAVGAR